MRVQTGTKHDYSKVAHVATVLSDGTINTACGAGVAKQTFYVLDEANERAGYCVRCYKAGAVDLYA